MCADAKVDVRAVASSYAATRSVTKRPPSLPSFVRRGAATSLAVLAVVGATGCHTVPEGRSAIYAVEVTKVGPGGPDADEIEDRLSTAASPKFLGLFRGTVVEYNLFERQVLQKDLARVEAACRAKGYYEAHARAGRVHKTASNHVRVEILVEPGPLVRIGDVAISGLDGLPEPLARGVRADVRRALEKDAPFEEEAFDRSKETALRALTDRGYAFAKVEADARVDLETHRAAVKVVVDAGPPQKLGRIRIEGIGSLPEDRVRFALSLRPDAPYSTKELEEARQAVLDLGVFASVEILPDIERGPRADGRVDLLVKLEPSKVHTLRFGGGVELDALKSGVHAVAGWEHRNFFGGLRRFRVDLTTGLVFYPLRVNNLVAPTDVFPEAKLRFDTRQPGLFGGRTAGFFRPSVEVYPVLIDPDPPKDAPVLGYAEVRQTLGIERTFGPLYGALSQNVQTAVPFSYLGAKREELSTVVISYPELELKVDLRDSRVKPRKGAYLGSSFQLAGVGGDARDLKIQPEARGYLPLGKRVVLAARAAVGFLFPQNYGSAVYGNPNALDLRQRTLDYQLVYFRGLFSGGPSSNRGYPARGVSPYGDVGFLSPDAERLKLDNPCGEGQDCRVPTGGFSLWEASVEVRVDIVGPLSAATFCDASDVSPNRGDIRLAHLHLSCGLGVRYDTPVGPIRLDAGYRIPELQVIGGLTPDEKEPSLLLGAPIAIALGVGEAF